MRTFTGLAPALAAAALLPTLGGCGTVDVPEECFYRLAAPRPAGGAGARTDVLRVDRLALSTHLRGDRLMVAEGPVLVRPYRFHRWAGPLEGMVEEVLVTGLLRSGAFTQVKGSGDSGTAALVLSGRVLELQQELRPDGRWCGRVTLELELLDLRRDRIVFQEEFRREVPIAAGEERPETVVAALSEGLAEVVDQILARARQRGLFDPGEQGIDAAPR